MLLLCTFVCFHITPAFCSDLFGSALLHEQLDWIKSELESVDIKTMPLKKLQWIQDAILSLESDIDKKIKKTEAKLQKYSEKISQIKEDKELRNSLKAIKSLEEDLKNFNDLQTTLEGLKAKLA